MDNKDLIETTRDIVVALINANLLAVHSKEEVNATVVDTIDIIYQRLVEINKNVNTAGKTIYTTNKTN